MSNDDLRIQLRDRAIEQLLPILEPFQVVALNMDDVGHDNGELFLRVFNRRNNEDRHKFVPLPSQVQEDLRAFLANGRPLYEELSRALFLSRFGRRLTARSIRMRHGRTIRRIKREIVEINEPCGEGGIEWFNKWNRAHIIYFMQRQDGVIKTGYSAAGLATRFQTLETEYGQMRLLGLMEGDKSLEWKIKRRFRPLCVEGTEWFHPAPELLAFIQRIVKEGRDGLPF